MLARKIKEFLIFSLKLVSDMFSNILFPTQLILGQIEIFFYPVTLQHSYLTLPTSFTPPEQFERDTIPNC